MKKIIVIFFLGACVSCNNGMTNKVNVTDSLNGEPEYVIRQRLKDSLDKDLSKRIYFDDTLGIENAPVKVLSANPVEQDYSNYKNIRLKFKNVSGKNISGIKFRWYGLNVFGDPADMGMGSASSEFGKGIGAGFTDDLLKAGSSKSSTFGISSSDLKKVIKAWPFEVAFEDGTKWVLKKK